MNKVHARSKSSKQPARRAPSSRATAADRRILAQAAREDAEGSTAPASTLRSVKGPAGVLRDAKAKVAAALAAPFVTNADAKAAVALNRRGQEEIAELAVPMTLKQVCRVIGVDCKPEQFAATALECLAGQFEAMRSIAESDELGPYDAYRVMENLIERMRLASRVTAWLESDEPLAALPEVQP